MRKYAIVRFFEQYLCEVTNGRSLREHENPSILFCNNAKAGKYDDMLTVNYNILLEEIEELSALWLNKSKVKAFDILRAALENINMTEKSIHEIAEILSECYLATNHTDDFEKMVLEGEGFEEYGDEDSDYDVEDDLEENIDIEEGYEDDSEDDSDWIYVEELDYDPEIYFGNNLENDSECEDNDSETISPDENPKEERRLPFEGKTILSNKNKVGSDTLASPPNIYKYLSTYVYGQKDAVRAATMLLYNHLHGRKRNILFVGPTGCGKTEIWRVCQKLYSNIHIVDSSVISADGWSGSSKVKDVFNNLSEQEAESAIIVFDEFDKLCEPQIGSSGTNHSFMVQNELLKLIEGTTIHIKQKDAEFDIDTSKISFVFCGSFELLTEMKTESESQKSIGFGGSIEQKDAHLIYDEVLEPSDLVKYASVRQEIAGRINQIVQLSPMTVEGYKAILNDEQMSPLHQLERQYGVKLTLEKDTEEKLLQKAEETRMGVRYLRSRIQQMLDEQMFKDCAQTEYQLGA